MPDGKKIVDFDTAKEPLLHRRREDKVKKMRRAFKAAREAFSASRKKNSTPKRAGKPKTKNRH